MIFPRSSGILLHPTSLPGRYGIGELGPEARLFIDFLHEAGQKLWQVLPLHPTGYADSPYQCFSAFAGNPLLIGIDDLVSRGYLSPRDIAHAPAFPDDEVDYGRVIDYKCGLLRQAACTFPRTASGAERRDFEQFCTENTSWLDDFALFMTAKQAHGGAVWTTWDESLRRRDSRALEQWRAAHAEAIAAQKFWQFVFFRQWRELRAYCDERAIRIMGDMPIYVAPDSADVWRHPELFELGAAGNPLKVAGVPPDYFSATGQLWGNPVYRWDVLAERGYDWWIDRMRATLALYDLIRLDHFRGFAAYWEIPANERTAMNGRWVPGPGAALFTRLQEALGELPIVAENLGVITPEVERLRRQFGFPGMAILQFAFGIDPQGPSFRPHNYARELVAYTGTHDNDTLLGWWCSAGDQDSVRTADDVRREHELARAYLGFHDASDLNWTFIRAIVASVADTAIMPLQDVLGCGSEGRMNMPSRIGGNWKWRFRAGALTAAHAQQLKQLTQLYDR